MTINPAKVSAFSQHFFDIQHFIINKIDTLMRPTSIVILFLSLSSIIVGQNSVLNDGQIFKIAIAESGVYKIDSDLISQMGFSSSDAAKIKVYGQRGGVVPQANAAYRVEDLAEIPVMSLGLEDGNWDQGDGILFYGEGANAWKIQQNAMVYEDNPYETVNYYFVKLTNSAPKQIDTNSDQVNNQVFSQFTDYQRFEEDKFNLLGESVSHQGSGKTWYGDQFKNTRERSYTTVFDFNGVVPNSQIDIKLDGAARSSSNSTIQYQYGSQVESLGFSGTDVSDIDSPYAKPAVKNFTFDFEADASHRIEFLLNGDEESSFWLNYLEAKASKQLSFDGNEMHFTNEEMVDHSACGFELTTTNQEAIIWDVTDPVNVTRQVTSFQNGKMTFYSANANQMRQFFVFKTNGNIAQPELVGEVENQNLRSISRADMLIVYAEPFAEAANRLAEHRRVYNDFEVELVEVSKIWNEFASGRQDPSAIRDLIRMIYTKDNQFQYVLLIGDGSYDFRNVKELDNPGNYIPVFETEEALRPIYAYPTDDFYVLMDEDEGLEGGNGLTGDNDLAIGRLPVNSADQANGLVNKIIHYETSQSCFGPWRTDLTYAADDGNGTLHISDCNSIAESTEDDHPQYIYNKVFFDAYQQISTPGGERYPEATEDIYNNVQSGQLITCYLGHGGPKGWAQERVLQASHINDWDNLDAMTVMITATCSFAGYDDPELISAGEHAILNSKGGVVSLLTTVRSVFTNGNKALTKASWVELFKAGIADRDNTIGDALRRAKNSITGDAAVENTRKYSLLGDPAMKLANPTYDVELTHINGASVDSGELDTISALEQITIQGLVTDNGIVLEDFNGEVFVRLYDKENQINTLQNDAESGPYTFKLRNTLLFKGKATVVNGEFTLEFILPQDINFDFGEGKFIFYATDYIVDASGAFDSIVIGGSLDGSITDNVGPTIELFMGNYNFQNGGTTNTDPLLIARLSDEHGINVSNTSIGHDLKATLDEDTQQSYIVSEYYEAELDDYTKGEVRYPFKDLEEGFHSVEFIAWDILNNSSKATLDFVVSTNDLETLNNVFNYPNPFSDETNFAFDHLGVEGDTEVSLLIFDSSGKKVKSLQYNHAASGFREVNITWDGTDTSGNKLHSGIYFYQIQLKDLKNQNTLTSEFQKLVILY